jgi:phenylpropionate dioxygenase-like ring-hydroxylating dioxygenase large terminal subunit
LLFVWSGKASAADPALLPLVPVLQEQGDGWADGWIVQDTFRDLPMDALTLLENVLDVSHVPFTHHRTVGKRENASPVEAVITREDSQGFEAFWQEGPRKGKLGSQDTHFRAPQLMWHDLTAKGFARIMTVVYAVPISRGKCRLFARFPFQFKAVAPRVLVGLRPRWLQHIGNHKVLEDDQVFLHWQERVLETAGGSAAAEQAFALPTSSDVYVKALHRWVNRQGGGPFAGQPLPPRQDVEVLMDRYHSHTKHCRSCSVALRRIRSLRPWLWGSLWLSAVLVGAGQLSWLLWLGIGLAALSGLALRQTSRWQRGMLVGDGQAPRNQRI